MTAPIQVSRIHYPVDVLGPGRRIGIWLQGCTIGCSGCVSRDTWDPDAGTATDVATLVDRLVLLVGAHQVDGVTVSGGEPFQQAAALAELVVELRAALDAGRERPVDVMVYSGYSYERLRRDHDDVLDLIDAVVPEPFLQIAPDGPRWTGSANQRVVPTSVLGRERFDEASVREVPDAPEIQVAVDDEVWMVGIPRRGDMERITAELGRRGIVLHEASWMP